MPGDSYRGLSSHSFEMMWEFWPGFVPFGGNEALVAMGLENNAWAKSALDGNTCVARASHAFNRSGITIPPSWQGKPLVRGSSGYLFITVAAFDQFLRSRFGPATLTARTLVQLDGNRGVVMIEVQGRLSHVDLLDGRHPVWCKRRDIYLPAARANNIYVHEDREATFHLWTVGM